MRLLLISAPLVGFLLACIKGVSFPVEILMGSKRVVGEGFSQSEQSSSHILKSSHFFQCSVKE